MSKHSKPSTPDLIDQEIRYGIAQKMKWPAGSGKHRQAPVKRSWWK